MKWSLPLVFALITLSFSTEAARKPRSKPAAAPVVSGNAFQKILIAEDQRITRDPFLLGNLFGASPTVTEAALIALGRIGDPAAIEPIIRILGRRGDQRLKKAAAFALGLIQDPTASKMLVQNIPLQKDPEVVAALLVGVGRSGNEQGVNTIANAIKDSTNPKLLEAGCHALGTLWSGGSEKWAVPPGLISQVAKLAQSPAPVGLSAAFAIARFKGESSLLPAEEVLEAARKTPSSEARALLCRALGKIKTAAVTTFLVNQVLNDTHNGTRIEAVKSLAAHTLTEEVSGAYKKALGDKMTSLVVQALDSLGAHGPTAMAHSEAVDELFRTHPSLWVKGTALKTLCKINATLGRQRLTEVLKATSSPLMPAAVAGLGILGQPEDVEKLALYVVHSDLKLALEAVEAISGYPEDKYSSSLKAAVKQAIERADVAVTALAAQIAEKHKWKDFAPAIAASYALFTAPDHLEVKVALINALGALGDRSHVPMLEELVKDPERLIVVAAVDAIRTLSAKDLSAKIPLNSKIVSMTPTWAEAQEATRARIVLTTSKGDIHLKMMSDTPLNALNFVRLVKQGSLKQSFYDGKNFHRVVPNFVVQGGDPRGDGYGGPGYLVRDEVSNRLHLRGTVGVATAGKDTGGCQFFINLAPNLHLDGRYTLFAEVTRGMDVADKLEIGDRIVSARILR